MARKEHTPRRFRKDFSHYMNNSIDDSVDSIAPSNSSYNPRRALGYGAGVAAILGAAAEASPIFDWRIETTRTTGNDGQPYQQFEHKVFNTSTNDSMYNLTSWQVNAGSDQGVYYARGSYMGSLDDWTPTITSNQTGWGYSPNGDPIAAQATTNGSWGLFTTRSRNMNYDQVAAVAQSSGNGPFDSALVPEAIPEPSTGILLALGLGVAFGRKKVKEGFKKAVNYLTK